MYFTGAGEKAFSKFDEESSGQPNGLFIGYQYTGFSSEIGTKLRDWAVGQAGGSCYSRAALSSNDSKTRYNDSMPCCLTQLNLNPMQPYSARKQLVCGWENCLHALAQ